MAEINEKMFNILKQRLEILIYAQLRNREIEAMTMGEQILLLKRLGLEDAEIAYLYDRTKSSISGEIVRQKKMGKKVEPK